MPRYEGWSDAQIATLRKLRAEGKTGAEIGERLGFSRSAVLVKVHHLGLSVPRARKQPDSAAAQKRLRVPKQAEASPLPPAPKPQTIEPAAPPAAPIPAVVVVERAKPAVDPSPAPQPQRPIVGGCCWPLWDDATPRSQRRQCDAPRDDLKSPYCPDHRERAVDKHGWQAPRVVQMIQPCR